VKGVGEEKKGKAREGREKERKGEGIESQTPGAKILATALVSLHQYSEKIQEISKGGSNRNVSAMGYMSSDQ